LKKKNAEIAGRDIFTKRRSGVMAKSRIEWTDAVWNPVTGCDPMSTGCANCYARRMSMRLAGRCGYPKENPFAVTLHWEKLAEPLRWRKPRRVFVCSMGDLFHWDVPDEFITSVFNVMDKAAAWHGHTFMVLTKRPERMMSFVNDWVENFEARSNFLQPAMDHIWLGVSAENQRAADERIPLLIQTPAAVRFVSCEPLLGEVDLTRYLWLTGPSTAGPWVDCLGRRRGGGSGIGGQTITSVPSGDISWVIAGGETGPQARPMNPDWVRGLRDQCQEVRVPFFFKSWGEWAEGEDIGDPHDHFAYHVFNDNSRQPCMNPEVFRVGKKIAGRVLDGRTWDEMPGGEAEPCALK
jgi:protein gp37